MKALVPHTVLALALAVGAVPWVAPGASATILADWDLEELARRSDLVVVGTVKEQRFVVDEKMKAVLTESELVVERTLQGKPMPTLVLTQLGGRAGSVVSEVMGDARLTPGARVLLFTFAHEDGRRYLVGMALGAWFMASGPDGALTQLVDSPLVNESGEVRPAPGQRIITIDDVKAAIEKAAQGGSPGTSQSLDRPAVDPTRSGP